MSMRETKRSDVVRPAALWFLVLDGGIVILTKLALVKPAYRKANERTDGALPPREALQALLILTAVIHAAEAVAAGRMARRRGLSPRGWRLQTLIVGFPSLLALRRRAPVRR
jgi:Domain of unknown function (DUF4499)